MSLLIRELGPELAATLLERLDEVPVARLDRDVPRFGARTAQRFETARASAGGFARLESLLEVPGVGVTMFADILRLLAPDEHAETVAAALERLAGFSEDELIRAARVSKADERDLVEFLNRSWTAATLAEAVADLGPVLAQQLLVTRAQLGGRFTAFGEIEAIAGLGEVRLAQLIRAAKSTPIAAPSWPLAAGAPVVRRALELVSKASVEQLRSRIDSLSSTRAEAIVRYRYDHGGVGSLAELLGITGLGTGFLRELVTAVADEPERAALDATFSELGEASEGEWAQLLDSSASDHRATLELINRAPSAEALDAMLLGVGPGTAAELFAERERGGGRFESLGEIAETSGVGAVSLGEILRTGASVGEDGSLLAWIWLLLDDRSRRGSAADELLALARQTEALDDLRLIGAALLALGALEPLAEVRERAGGPEPLGIPDPPWLPIPKGSFVMGASEADELAEADELPPLEREVGALEALATPVTVALYAVVARRTPGDQDLRRPVAEVSWSDANEFCVRLIELSGRVVRLPAELEWEYLCRAGTTTRYFPGDDEDQLASVAWYGAATEDAMPVSQKPANEFGLGDVHGNVWEWCRDNYGPYPGANEPLILDGRKVLRGGSFLESAAEARSSNRRADSPDLLAIDVGFRVVVATPEPLSGGAPPPEEGGGDPPPPPPPEDDIAHRIGEDFEIIPEEEDEDPPRPVTQPNSRFWDGYRDFALPSPYAGLQIPQPAESIGVEPRPPDCPPCPACSPCPPECGLTPEGEDEADDVEAGLGEAKDEEDQDQDQDIDDTDDELDDDDEDANDEQDRRDDSPQRRARQAEEDRLDQEREELDERREDLDQKREEIEERRGQEARRDRELREEEQRAREHDPNCRGPLCRSIRQERQDLAEHRSDTNQMQRELEQGARDLGNRARQYNDDRRQLDSMLDRGFGQTREEFRLRRMGQAMSELERQRQSIRGSLQRLQDNEERHGGLSGEERRLRDALEGQLGQLTDRIEGGHQDMRGLQRELAGLRTEHGAVGREASQIESERGNIQRELARLEGEDDHGARADSLRARDRELADRHRGLVERQNALLGDIVDRSAQLDSAADRYADSLRGRYEMQEGRAALGDDAADQIRRGFANPSSDARDLQRRARRNLQMRQLSDGELAQYRGDIASARSALDNLRQRVRNPGDVGPAPDAEAGIADARQRLEAAQDELRRINERRRTLEHDAELTRSTRNRTLRELDQTREQLRRHGATESSQPTGSAREQAEIQRLQDQARSLRDEAFDLERHLNDNQRAIDGMRRQIPGLQREALIANPLGQAGRVQGNVEAHHERWTPYFDAEGQLRDSARELIARQVAARREHANLRAFEQLAQDAIDRGAGEQVREHLATAERRREALGRELEGHGWTPSPEDERDLIPDTDSVIGEAFVNAFRRDRVAERRHAIAKREARARAGHLAAAEAAEAEAERRADGGLDPLSFGAREVEVEVHRSRAEQLDDRATQERDPATSNAIDWFVTDTLGLATNHPIAEVLHRIAGAIGAQALAAYLGSLSVGQDQSRVRPWALIERLFDELILPTAGEQGDAFDVAALLALEASALTTLRQRQRGPAPAEPDTSAGSSTDATDATDATGEAEPELPELPELPPGPDPELEAARVRVLERYAEALRVLEVQARREGRLLQAERIRALRAGVRARAELLRDRDPGAVERAFDEIHEILDPLIEMADAAGERGLARDLAQAVVEAESLAQEGLLERAELEVDAGAELEPYEAAARESSARLADDLSTLRGRLDAAADVTPDPDRNAALRREGSTVALMEAMHRVHAGQWDRALAGLDEVPDFDDPAFLRWKAQIALQGYVALQAQRVREPAVDDASHADDVDPDAPPEFAAQEDEFLARVERDSDEPEAVATATVLRARLREQAGRVDEARDHLRAAKDSSHPRILLERIRLLLLQDDPDDAALAELFGLLAELDGDDARVADRMALVGIASHAPRERLAAIADLVEASPLDPARQRAWRVELGLVELAAGSHELTAEAIDSRVAELQALLDEDIDLDPEERAVIATDLASLRGSANSYMLDRDRLASDPESFAPDELMDLVATALRFDDDATFERALHAWAGDDRVSPRVRLEGMTALVDAFAQAARQAGESGSGRWSQRLDRVQAEASTALRDARRVHERELAGVLDRMLELDLQYERDGWFESAALSTARFLNFATGVDDVMNEADARSRQALLSHQGTLEGELIAAERLTLEIRLHGIHSLFAEPRIDAEVERLRDEIEALEQTTDALADAAREDDDATNEPLTAQQIRIAARWARLAAWEDAGFERAPIYATSGESSPISAAERHVDRLDRESHRAGWWDTFGDRSLQAQIDTFEVGLEDDDIAGHWRLRLLRDRMTRRQRRIGRLIESGPIRDPRTGEIADSSYRRRVEGRMLQARLTRIESIVEDYEAVAENSPDLFAADVERWRARATAVQDQIALDPTRTALAQVRGPITRKAYIEELIVSLNRYKDFAYRGYFSYIPDSQWDLGLAQAYHLHWADVLGDRDDAHSRSSVLARIVAFEDEIHRVQMALLSLYRGDPLDPDQLRLLVACNVLVAETDETGETVHRVQIGAPIELGDVRERLDQPNRSWVDELFNLRSMTEMLAITLLAAVTSGAAIGLVGRLGFVRRLMQAAPLLARGAGYVGRTLANAVAFTAASRVTTAASDATFGRRPGVGPQPGIVDELQQNLVMFGVLGAFGAAAGRLRVALAPKPVAAGLAGARLQAARAAGNFARQRFIVRAFDASVFVAEAAVSAAVEAAMQGNPLTMEGFVRNLVFIPGMNRLSHRVAQRVSGAATPSSTARRTALRSAPLVGDPNVDPRHRARVETRHQPVLEALGTERARLEQRALDDLDGIRRSLEPLGIAVEVAAPGSERGTYLARSASGDLRVVIDGDSTRMDVRNEVYKASQLELLGLTPDRALTSEIEALIEFRSYREMERAMFRGTRPVGRYARSIGLSLHWKRELDAIRSGQRRNSIVHAPGDGLLLFAQRPSDVTALRRRLAQELGSEWDPTRHPPLEQLGERVRELLSWHLERLPGRIERRNAAQRELANARPEDVDAASAEYGRRQRLLDETLDRVEQLLDGLERVRRQAVAPEVVATLDRASEWRRTEGREQFADLAKHRLDLRQKLEQLEAEYATASAADRRVLEARRKALMTQLRANSQQLGERGGVDILATIPELRGAVPFYTGEGARRFDRVYVLGDRIIVVEEKGHGSTLGGKWVGGVRAEQISVLHTLGTALEMSMAGELASRSSDPTTAAHGVQLIEVAQRIFDGIKAGTLEAYVTRTVWDHDSAAQVEVGETTFTRVEYPSTPLSPSMRTIVIRPQPGRAPRRPLPVSLVSLHSSERVRIQSDGTPTGQEWAQLRRLAAQIRQSRALGAEIVAFPEDTVVIRRTDGASSYARLLRDPALAHLRTLAQLEGVHVMLGVRFDGPESPRLGVFVARPDGTSRLVPHNANLRESGLARVRVSDVEVGLALCADAQCVVDPTADLHLVIANARPSVLDGFLRNLPNSLGVNWVRSREAAGIHIVENRWTDRILPQLPR